jgi:hypothetical protein
LILEKNGILTKEFELDDAVVFHTTQGKEKIPILNFKTSIFPAKSVVNNMRLFPSQNHTEVVQSPSFGKIEIVYHFNYNYPIILKLMDVEKAFITITEPFDLKLYAPPPIDELVKEIKSLMDE